MGAKQSKKVTLRCLHVLPDLHNGELHFRLCLATRVKGSLTARNVPWLCSAEDVERTRQKATEHSKLSRAGGTAASRNGLEGAALQISETTGSIIMGGTEKGAETHGGSSPASKKSKKERKEKRDKRREKDWRQGAEQAPRPSKDHKGSSGKRRPKVGA